MASRKPKRQTTAQVLATSGAALRQLREKGVLLTFPSGNNYRVCLPGASGMLRRGNLPNPLLSFVTDAFFSGPSQAKYDKFLEVSDKAEDAVALMDSLKVVCQAMFMDPLVVDSPEAGNEAAIEDIPLIDQLWAFRLLFAPVDEVQPFRGEQALDVVGVPVAQGVPQTTER